MKTILIALTFFVSTANRLSVTEMRNLFYKGVEDEDLTEQLAEKLESVVKPTAYEIAYLGGAYVLRAKHAYNPYNKISWLKKGDKKIGTAISLYPQNIEFRFMRFSYEHYLPEFLGMSEHLEVDRQTIVKGILNKQYNPADLDLIRNMVKFLFETNRCTTSEISALKAWKP